MPLNDENGRAHTEGRDLYDQRGRPLRELRVSVTDRCNFRCRYCMPREHFGAEHDFAQKSEILTFEQVVRVVRVLRERGLGKVRLTGGEPLLRRELGKLVRQLKSLPGLEVALTTNGSLLSDHAAELHAAGLDRLTVSLDALDEATFHLISDSRSTPNDVLRGIASAERAGFKSLKINCVVKRGVNENQIMPLVEHFRYSGHELRFIEYMDAGETNGWHTTEVVTAREIFAAIGAKYPLIPEDSASPSQTSQMVRYRDGAGRVGVIASVSQPFCGGCTRARLTAKGELYTCLFGTRALDVRELIHAGASDSELDTALSQSWSERDDRYSEMRASANSMTPRAASRIIPVSGLRRALSPRSEMSYLGG